MPFPKVWVEELIIEWLHLEGFLVEANLPVGVAEPGGRLEVDVVGAKISDDVLKIRHVETGQLSGGEESIDSINNKFDKGKKLVENYFIQKFSFKNKNDKNNNKIDYQKIYVATYWTEPTIQELKNFGIKVYKWPEFICEEVLPAIKNWKDNPPHQPKTRGKNITLPESYWLLNLIDYLNTNKMLRCHRD